MASMPAIAGEREEGGERRGRGGGDREGVERKSRESSRPSPSSLLRRVR